MRYFATIILLSILLLESHSLIAQADELVRRDELVFHSEAERQAYLDVLDQPTASAYFRAFLHAGRISSDAEAKQFEQRLNALLKPFKGERWSQRSQTRKINAVYKTIHADLFKRYELKNHFESIFKNGYYNCVSASAVFAVSFEKLDIPYQVMEAPAHVYLAANPGSNRVLVETTDPIRGYFEFDQGFKNNFRNHLKSSKLITEEEYYNYTADELFDKYYFADNPIDIRQLVGLQYANLGIYRYVEEDWREARDLLTKSYLLYPVERTRYMLMQSAALLANESDFNRIEDAGLFTFAARFVGYGLDRNILISKFYDITNTHLLNSLSADHYRAIYGQIEGSIADSTLSSRVGFVYNYESARIYLNNGYVQDALPHLERALALNAENNDLKVLIVRAVIKKAASEADPSNVLPFLEKEEERFPFLREQGLYIEYRLEVLLWQASYLFDLEKMEEANECLKLFEAGSTEREGLEISASAITRAYGDGAASYFRNGRKQQAKELLQRGLQALPNSYELNRRLEMIR